MHKRSLVLFFSIPLLALSACGDEQPVGPAVAGDAGDSSVDAADGDDASLADAGQPPEEDAGFGDAGPDDAGDLDAGDLDAGDDAGLVDGGEDAGEPDAGPPQPFTFALMTDLHIGQWHGSYAGQEDDNTEKARAAVASINALDEQEPIAFAFILGDLTDSAEESEFLKAREILDGLQIPWFPLLGNHDVWKNTSDEGNTVYPTGDATFASLFGDRFRDATVGEVLYPDETIWNPERGFECRFQSFELRYQGVVFLGLDWNSRKRAVVRGAAPEADLHDFPGGTFRFMQERLAALPPVLETRRIINLQHHGFRTAAPTPDWYFTFSGDEKDAFEQALQDTPVPRALYYGVFAGHTHREWEGEAFDDWPEYEQVETDDSASAAAVTLVRVDLGGRVQIVRP